MLACVRVCLLAWLLDCRIGRAVGWSAAGWIARLDRVGCHTLRLQSETELLNFDGRLWDGGRAGWTGKGGPEEEAGRGGGDEEGSGAGGGAVCQERELNFN